MIQHYSMGMSKKHVMNTTKYNRMLCTLLFIANIKEICKNII